MSRPVPSRKSILVVLCTLVACAPRPTPPTEPPTKLSRAPASAEFLGRQRCVGCHQLEAALYQGSHHDLAMQPADKETVLADFDNVSFTHFGHTTTFFEKDGGFWVRSTNADGGLSDVRLAFTFGSDPLQQYLVELAGGRLQALPFVWDSRPSSEGGQHWFHIYPDEEIPPGDVLHWAGRNQNWNHMCAECHSTNVRKNYDPASDEYRTEFSEIDVSCESCHGPGSVHVEWAQRRVETTANVSRSTTEPIASADSMAGLTVRLRDVDEASWTIDPDTGIGARSRPRTSRSQVETCARCHSRRSVITDSYRHGEVLMASHMPALLEESLYHPDGQMLDEVYVYGSFLQSKMYRAGVTCSDCHDPHSLEVRGAGNNACAGCHLPERFDTPQHHRHTVDSAGARCVECHMPTKTYMVVDERRDHSFRIPRPDLSLRLGTPNACNDCHQDRSTEWAAAAAQELWPELENRRHFAAALAAGRKRAAHAADGLQDLANDPEMPAISRATALAMLQEHPRRLSRATVETGLADVDPIVRLGASRAAEALDPATQLRLLVPLLADPVRAVRLEVARAMAALPPALLDLEQSGALDFALDEYRHAQAINADRPEAHLNLGLLHMFRGSLDEAEKEYRIALEQAPTFVPVYVNLADLLRAQDRDDEGEQLLRSGLANVAENADLNHALGLALVRRGRLGEAIDYLSRAAEARPGEVRYSYVLGVALESSGEVARALATLDEAHRRHPAEPELLSALATFHRKHGSLSTALDYANRLLVLDPSNPESRQLVAGLESLDD